MAGAETGFINWTEDLDSSSQLLAREYIELASNLDDLAEECYVNFIGLMDKQQAISHNEYFLELFPKLQPLATKIKQVLQRDGGRNAFRHDFSEKMTRFLRLKKDLKNFIEKDADTVPDKDAVTNQTTNLPKDSTENIDTLKMGDSASQISKNSSHSSSVASKISILRLEAVQKQAELLARAAALKAKQQLEAQKQEMKSKEEELQLQLEMDVSTARLKALENFEENHHSGSLSHQNGKTKSGKLSIHSGGNNFLGKAFIDNQADNFGKSLVKHQFDNMATSALGNTIVNKQFKNIDNCKVAHHNCGKQVAGTSLSAPIFSKTQVANKNDVSVTNRYYSTNNYVPFNNNNGLGNLFSDPTRAKVSEGNANDNLAIALDNLADKIVMKDNLPNMVPEKFGGDILKYIHWLQSFETIIERNATSISQKMFFLNKLTYGEANAAISSYLTVITDESYNAAKKRLHNRYGNKYLLAKECKKRIRDWPHIKHGDGKSLREFSDFLLQCEVAMTTSSFLNSLNSEEEISIMLSKLPRHILDRWCRLVDKSLNAENEDEQCYPPFSKFCEFLEIEARIVCNTVGINNDYRSSVSQRSYSSGKSDTKVKTFSTHTTGEKAPGYVSNKDSKPKRKCFLCGQEHLLETCEEFLKMTVENRKGFIKSKGLCFSCIRGRHLAKECKNRKKCKTCNGSHPTELHVYSTTVKANETPNEGTAGNSINKTETNTVVSHKTQIKEAMGSYNSLILPVKLTFNGKELKTYALLDEQSNSCFITTAMQKGLQAQGKSVKIKLGTMLAEEYIDSTLVDGLKVCSLISNYEAHLPGVYIRESIPIDRNLIPRPETANKWEHLKCIANKIFPYEQNLDVGLLIGLNCPGALKPRELIPGKGDEPWAVLTNLGWGIAGNIDPSHFRLHNIIGDKPCHLAFRTQVSEVTPIMIQKMFDIDFNERKLEEKLSFDDRLFIDKVSKGIQKRDDGHLEMPLPIKNNEIRLPNNRTMALKRLSYLKTRLMRDHNYKKDYYTFMDGMLKGGFAEKVLMNQLSGNHGRVWYIPHHGVYHPKKPGKIRIVFDCSAKWEGQSLNQHLLQGPDLINNLTGILCRFRQEEIAISCDIEGMFHQVGVNKEDRDLLRFFWWENGNLQNEPTEYRMTVHLFGATSSPGCANFALKYTADSYKEKYGKSAAEFIESNFYVDDGLRSVATVNEAKDLIHKTRAMCKEGGFNLHKFLSNNKDVLANIDPTLRAKDIQDLDFNKDSLLPIERTLGILWCVESDCFRFRLELGDKPLTRRGILSTVCSIFDPLGLIAPFVLIGKRILQEVVRDKRDWDDPLSEDLLSRWDKWRKQLPSLASINIPRCYKENDFGQVTKAELHHFSDASLDGYGQCSYLRLFNKQGKISCVLVMAKSRVGPSKAVTMPRLELTAAVTSAKIGYFLSKELEYKDIQHYFWTDSKVVLGYIKNESKRFHIFVANRVQQIRELSSTEQWQYVESRLNPADLASRGATVCQLLDSSLWWNGPQFLWSNNPLPLENENYILTEDDPEIKKLHCLVGSTNEIFADLCSRLEYFSDWYRAKRAVANCYRIVKAKAKRDIIQQFPLLVEDLQRAEKCIILEVQKRAFPEERKILKEIKHEDLNRQECKYRNMTLKKDSKLSKLDPYMDESGIIHVGGRVKRANIPIELQHPIVLPKDHHITRLIIDHFHKKIEHSGCGMTLNEIRASGFWILQARSAVSSYINKCVFCRRLRWNVVQQKMSDLPDDRLTAAEPFTYSAVDLFGHFFIKEGRSEKKRWGVLFSCMASRAVHLEVVHSLSTDSFINAYRRFVSRRGPVRQLRCDRGTNFVGAQSDFKQAMSEMDDVKIASTLSKENCDWVTFNQNLPYASHRGGSWERLIRNIRNVLTVLLTKHGERINDEQLHTFMVEAEAIVNSRPITYPDVGNSSANEPLSPFQLLTLKSKVIMPPPGVFMKEDMYCRKRWRAVQHLVNEFWDKWRIEYLASLQERTKWITPQPNLKVSDIVVIKDVSVPRNQWPLARIVEVLPSDDSLVRKVKIKRGNNIIERAVQNLVLIYSPEEPG